jgi:5-methyltetrahydropteroyltriglutamate--homocysteine methyltransferase
VDGYLLEYDDERSGGFEPLRAIPGIAALGLISTKRAALEPADEIRRRVDEAAHYLTMERLALCPQCGFSSGAGVTIGTAGATGAAAGAGGVAGVQRMSFEEQERKLEHMVSLAAQIWS